MPILCYTLEKKEMAHTKIICLQGVCNQRQPHKQLQNNMKTAKAWPDVKLYRNRNKKTF